MHAGVTLLEVRGAVRPWRSVDATFYPADFPPDPKPCDVERCMNCPYPDDCLNCMAPTSERLTGEPEGRPPKKFDLDGQLALFPVALKRRVSIEVVGGAQA